MLKVSCFSLAFKFFSNTHKKNFKFLILARKKLESFVPIVRKDADIVNLLARRYQDVTRVLDIFIRAQTSVHLLRATEPMLRFGKGLAEFLENNHEELPKCEYWNTTLDWKCVDIVSKTQLAQAVVALDRV